MVDSDHGTTKHGRSKSSALNIISNRGGGGETKDFLVFVALAGHDGTGHAEQRQHHTTDTEQGRPRGN